MSLCFNLGVNRFILLVKKARLIFFDSVLSGDACNAPMGQ